MHPLQASSALVDPAGMKCPHQRVHEHVFSEIMHPFGQ